MDYAQQIKHPLWQKKRLEVLQLHGFCCQECKASDQELHVHHPFYKRGAMIWEYDKKELKCLCYKCHKKAHELDEEIKKALAMCQDKKAVLAALRNIIPQTRPKVKKHLTRAAKTIPKTANLDDMEYEAEISAEEFFRQMRELMGDIE